MKLATLIWLFFLSTSLFGALPGVTEFRASPEKISDTELAPLLDRRVADADVVALGETVHGSSAMLHMQTRVIRYLVEKHGLRLILWENPPLRSLELSAWVASCTQRKTAAPLAVLYMPTAADRALWDWICDFNSTHPDSPIVFRGMDVWDRPWEHYAQISALAPGTGIDGTVVKRIETSCPMRKTSSWSEIDAVLGHVRQAGKFLPETDYGRCRIALTAVLEAARRTGLQQQKSKASDVDAHFELAISASTLLGWLGFYHYNWSDDVLSWNERDQAQARNAMLLMEKHGMRRAILSAHTSHVSHNRSPADWWGYGDLKSGVYFFTAMTGKKVFNIAFTAYEASGTQGNWSLPTAANSLDRKMYAAKHSFAFFAADASFLMEHPRWWLQNQNFPGRYESGVELVPADHFDAFVFFDKSHLDQALPSRPMWQP